MGLVDKFEIVFEYDPPVYSEGGTITGEVHLTTTEDIRCKCIRLELHGVSIVHWTRLCITEVEHDSCRTRADVLHEEYSEKIIFLEKDGSFLGKERLLASGEHVFPFSVKLPCELPSSFEGEYGQVRYTAVAIVERSGFKSNIIKKRAFTVLTGLDLSFIPEAMTKIEICKYKKLGRSEGAVTIDWLVDRAGFVPGQEIPISGSIQNDSKHTVLNSAVAMLMVITYKSRRKWKKERRKIVGHEKGVTSKGEVTLWNEGLIIPPLPPTGLNRSKVIDIAYELEFRVTIAGGSQPVVCSKPIYIGTVPVLSDPEMTRSYATMLRHDYSSQFTGGDVTVNLTDDPYASLPSLTDAIAAAAVTEGTTNPSAPSMLTLRGDSWTAGQGDSWTPDDASNLPADIINPPPFAPGHNEDGDSIGNDDDALFEDLINGYQSPVVCEPSAPSENTLMRPWSGVDRLDESIVDADTLEPQGDLVETIDPEKIEEPSDGGFQPIYIYYPTIHRVKRGEESDGEEHVEENAEEGNHEVVQKEVNNEVDEGTEEKDSNATEDITAL